MIILRRLTLATAAAVMLAAAILPAQQGTLSPAEQQRRKDLEAGTRLLLDKETITPEEFPALLPELTRQAAE